jgi:hypothetical protein
LCNGKGATDEEDEDCGDSFHGEIWAVVVGAFPARVAQQAGDYLSTKMQQIEINFNMGT